MKSGAVPQRWTISGATIVTTFAVTVVSSPGAGEAPARPEAPVRPLVFADRRVDRLAVAAGVRRVLERIEGRMSHYRPEPELSRFKPRADDRAAADVAGDARRRR